MNKIIIFIAILFGVVASNAQNSIVIPDTTLERAVIYRIPVMIFSDSDIDKISLQIEYDETLLDIKNVETDETTSASELEYFELFENEGGNRTFLRADLQYGNASDDNILCYIILEALAGPDSIAFLNTEKLILNGEESDDYDFKNSTIFIPGELIYPGNLETFSHNYPNPFYYETKFNLNLSKNSNIEIKLYNTSGRLIAEYPGNQNEVVGFVIRKDGNDIPNDYDPLVPGEYNIVLLPFSEKFSSGIYYLYLQTETAVYKRNLIYQK